MNFCRFCGTKLPRPQSRFCPECGKHIAVEEHSPDTSSPLFTITTPKALIASFKPSDSIVEKKELQKMEGSDDLIAGRYKLIRPVGNGNMSEVYQAEDIRHINKIVAVKLLNTPHKDAIKQEMYLRETRALEQLEHPNIIKHIDYGWSDEKRCHYIVLEYLPHSLVDEIARHRDSQDRSWCWPLMRDITDALVHAHSKGIIHRDLKSTNILIAEPNILKLTDFGISLLRFEVRRGVTLSGYWSEGYASPEQRNMQKTTEQSDLYSLGCVFYHMLSGKEPSPSGVSIEEIQASNFPPLAKQMFPLLLATEAQDRFQNAEHLARFLENTKKLQAYPEIYFRVTDTARTHLFDSALIQRVSSDDACQYLNKEFVNDSFPKEIQIKIENKNRFHIFTDTLKLVCAKDENLPLFSIIAIDTYVYQPMHEDQRNHVSYYRRQWRFIKNSRELPEENHSQLQQNIDELLDELSTHKNEEQEFRKQKSERKDFTKIWNRILELQQQLLDDSPKLKYSSWQREGNTITFQLEDTIPDDLGWPESAPIAFQKGKRMESIGLLMGKGGTTVEVSTTQGGTLEQPQSSKSLPQTGIIGLFQIETHSALERQRRALEMLISGGTVNPRLPEVLQDLSTAKFDPLDENIEFYQQLGEDQKSAVRQALATQDVFLLQGPPGTGKTTTLAEIILQILRDKPDARILVSSQSNVAVNNVLTRVATQDGVSRVGILRIGRPDRIGPGAEEWTLEKQLSTWRDTVISRTAVIIKQLEEKVQAQDEQLHIFRNKLAPVQVQDLEQCKIWLEELVSDIDDFNDYGQRIERLLERMNAPDGQSDRKAKDTKVEIEEYKKKTRAKREHISEMLELVRQTLPGDYWQNADLNDPAKERIRLYQIVTGLLSPGPTASTEEKILIIVRNWQSVFGKLDDFAEPLYERANILAATCLITGSRKLRDVEFDWAIIDEGGRATATELLVPLVRSRRSIIVGDERQLPPMLDTDVRAEALKHLNLRPGDLEKSLFETLVIQGKEEELPAVQMLKEQHRMHPSIGEMISQVFYDGKLKHASHLTKRNHKLKWLGYAVVWYSTTKLPHHAERQRNFSFSNLSEVNAIVKLLDRLEKSYREIGEKREVAIITPYNEQIILLRENIKPSNHSRWISLVIEIATVDAFQGRDSNIVIYSTVRSNAERELGFLKDRRRLNVALSRAQQLLVMVGDIGMLGSARAGKEGDRNPYLYLIRYMRNNPDDCLIQDLKQEDLHE